MQVGGSSEGLQSKGGVVSRGDLEVEHQGHDSDEKGSNGSCDHDTQAPCLLAPHYSSQIHHRHARPPRSGHQIIQNSISSSFETSYTERLLLRVVLMV